MWKLSRDLIRTVAVGLELVSLRLVRREKHCFSKCCPHQLGSMLVGQKRREYK